MTDMTEEPQDSRLGRAAIGLVMLFLGCIVFTIIATFVIMPPWFLLGGGVFGAILMAVLGIFVDTMLFREVAQSVFGDSGRNLVRLTLFQKGAVIVIAVFLIARPLPGDWTQLQGTDDFNNTVAHVTPDGQLLALTGAGLLLQTQDGWQDLNYPGEFAWEIGSIGTDSLWVAPRDAAKIHTYNFPTATWDVFDRPHGNIQGAIWHDSGFHMVIGHRLHVGDLARGVWQKPFGDQRVDSVAGHPGLLLVVGERWHESWDGLSWRDVTPPDVPEGWTIAAVAGAHRHVSIRNRFEDIIYSAAPGGDFEPCEVPFSDVRAMATAIDHGPDLWVGTWGRGVWRKEAHACHWIDTGLQTMEIRNIALASNGPGVVVASGNTVFQRGLFIIPHTVQNGSGAR